MKHRALALALSEAEAIERAKQGDAEAFELLYGLRKRRVYSWCLRMTANSSEAEDLTQEVFMQLFRKIGTFRGESAFSTWLHRMTVNVVLMQLRKKSIPMVPLEETLENEEETPKKELGAQDPVLSGSIDRLRLQRAVDALPLGYRRIFVLHDVEGYEHNEIAIMEGCSIGNSKSQLHKARMKLRESLKTSRAEKARPLLEIGLRCQRRLANADKCIPSKPGLMVGPLQREQSLRRTPVITSRSTMRRKHSIESQQQILDLMGLQDLRSPFSLGALTDNCVE